MGLCFSAAGDENDKTSLTLEFNTKVSCQMAKHQLSPSSVLVQCDRNDQKKVRYFHGMYLGNLPIQALIFGLKKQRPSVNISAGISPKRL